MRQGFVFAFHHHGDVDLDFLEVISEVVDVLDLHGLLLFNFFLFPLTQVVLVLADRFWRRFAFDASTVGSGIGQCQLLLLFLDYQPSGGAHLNKLLHVIPELDGLVFIL